MKATKLLLLAIIAFAFTSFTIVTTDSKIAAQSREFYQLKTYILNSEQQVQTTDKYLKEAYLPALKNWALKTSGFLNQDQMLLTR